MHITGHLAVCWGLAGAYLVSPAVAAPDYWDPRLSDLGVCYFEADVPQGTWYWKLISGAFEDETQSGGTHHIYYKCLDESGQPIEHQRCWAGWPSIDLAGPCPGVPDPPANQIEHFTKGPGFDDYWGNFGMAGGWCPYWPTGPHGPYGAWVGDAPSDEVWGMGLPCNLHVNYRYYWQWTSAAPPPDPEISRSPGSFTRRVAQGENLSRNTFDVWNSGGGVLNYSITDDSDWLSVNPASGTSTGEVDTITIDYSTAGLDLGTYHATIGIADPGAVNSPQTVAVTVTVQALVVPGDFDGDGDVDQEDFGHFQACLTGAGIPQNDPACADAKLDEDVDVDQYDFGIFEDCMSGPAVPGDPNCAAD